MQCFENFGVEFPPWLRTWIQVYPTSSLSFDQPKQSDSPNGKMTPAVLLLHEAK